MRFLKIINKPFPFPILFATIQCRTGFSSHFPKASSLCLWGSPMSQGDLLGRALAVIPFPGEIAVLCTPSDMSRCH